MGGDRRRGGRGLAGRNARGGFTLVELSIAIVVLMVAVLTTVEVQLASYRLVRTGQETNTIMADLGAAMEELLLLPKDDIPVAGSLFEAEQAVAAYEDLHVRNERIIPTYPGYVAGGPVPDPLEIVLTATWIDHAGRPRSLQLSSMKTQ